MKTFKCSCCGACCRWPGVVYVREKEMPAIAAHLGISVQELIDRYTRLSDDRTGLVYKDNADGSCIFLTEDNLCRIHAVKPEQCRTFPYDWNVPEDMRKLCHGTWLEDVPKEQASQGRVGLIHVLGHPDLPLDVAAHPEDSQVFNCHNFCKMLAFLGIPYKYYGVPGSKLPGGQGEFVSTGKPRGRWSFRNAWHKLYNQRLRAALEANKALDGRVELVASMYGIAQFDIDENDLPVMEPMLGYEGCWSDFKVFPSYSHQSALYALQQKMTWENRFYDTVIPHFVAPEDYHVSLAPRKYLLYLGRNAPDKGVDIAKQCADEAGLVLKIATNGWTGDAKAELLANARAVLVPTRYLEPFGYVAIEAQMSGTPVITTDWGAFPEIVEQGVTGFRCRSAAEFARAIRMAGDLDRLDIRHRAIRRFGLENVAPQYERYFMYVWNIFKNGGYYSVDALR